jgi:tRNA 2-selenouridine synthase
MAQVLPIAQFIEELSTGVVLDVRTPTEYAHGHIPGAVNLPLFSDDERAVVGTIYKNTGREAAILKGLDITGPKMRGFIEAATVYAANKPLYIYCWRGGMRSLSMSWLLGMYGFRVHTLKGGYKSFRNWVLDSFTHHQKLQVLGGKTGSGKTKVLYALILKGEQVMDLEGLACHKGSAFGSIGEPDPPSQEHFENLLAMELVRMNPGFTTWIEDESRTIGKKILPIGLWEQMRSSPVIFLEIPLEERIAYLVSEYGKYPVSLLEASVLKVRKRLGDQASNDALIALAEGKLDVTAGILLKYYDKAYMYGLEARQQSNVIKHTAINKTPDEIAGELLKLKTD